jgi:nitrogen-specific signal transduction histidine kinase
MKQAIQFNHDLFSCVGEIGLDGPVLSISMTLAGMIFGPLIGWMEEGHGLTLKIALNSIKGDVKFVVKSKSGGRNELWVQLKVTHENEGSIEENHQIASF